MKKALTISIFLAFLGLSTIANAALVVNGIDTRGSRLIYDTDLNITWYDYVDQTSGALSVGAASGWATNLSVTANGNVYTEWRLPSTVAGSGNLNLGEMGHLYYTELGNSAGWLTNQGPFSNLLTDYDSYCWTSTASAWYGDGTPYAYYRFSFRTGNQASYSDYHTFRAFAVHDGNIGSTVPVPAAAWLLGSGLLGLFGVRRKFMK